MACGHSLRECLKEQGCLGAQACEGIFHMCKDRSKNAGIFDHAGCRDVSSYNRCFKGAGMQGCKDN